jgi:peroxiredoxin
MPAADAPLKTIAEWHLDRIEILRELIQHVKGPDEQLPFYKEVVNDLAAAYQTGLYPEGEKVFERLVEQGGKIGSYAAYRLILAGFELAGREPGANQLQLQLATIKKLKEFLEKNPGSDEEPEALYYVATALEFNGEEEEAKTYYTDLAEKHAAVPAGKTAAGALRRLSLEGQALKLAGPDAAGKTITADQFKGKTLLVHFWTAAADPERSELAELAKVYQRQKAKGLEILGVCLDADKAAAQEFLKENQITWPQILEEGGMDSRLSNEFGIITTPTMFLVDPTGKVTSRKLRKASEVETSIERAPVAGRSANGLNR